MEPEVHINRSSISTLLELLFAIQLTHEIDTKTEDVGSKLWDLSSTPSVAEFLAEQQNLEHLLLLLQQSRDVGCSRLEEICLGIAGNLYACPSAHSALCTQNRLQGVLIDVIAFSPATGPLSEALRAATAACNVQVSGWCELDSNNM
jgi:hypothetical protein